MMNKRKAVAIAVAREQQIARSMEILFAPFHWCHYANYQPGGLRTPGRACSPFGYNENVCALS